jgi:beta-lactamase superfamily II metal-dependent hydrolase
MRNWAIGILAASLGLLPAAGRAAQASDPVTAPAAEAPDPAAVIRDPVAEPVTEASEPAAATPGPAANPATGASEPAIPVAAASDPVNAAAVPVRGPPPPGTYVVHTIDVGTGLAVFVEGSDFALLYDAGSNDDAGREEKNRVIAYLRAVRPDLTHLDHVIVSHPHKDHHEMLDDVFTNYDVDQVWDSGALHTSCGYRVYIEAVLHEPDVVYHNAAASGGTHNAPFGAASCRGQSFSAGTVRVPRGSVISATPISLGAGASMTILHADSTKRDPHLNDASVVVRLDLGSRRVLLPGDAEAGGERSPPTVPPRPDSVEGKLLICCTPDLRSDVLVAAHHGSKTSSRNTFLDAVGASDFVISSGPKKYSGTQLPSQEVVDELTRRAAAKGGKLLRTDRDDEACKDNPAKVGRDDDGKPGGCDNVRIVIGADGSLAADYVHPVD